MNKEVILLKHCDGTELGRHPSDDTYCEIGGAIDGKTEHVLAAMEEYADLKVKEFLRQNEPPCWAGDGEVMGEVPCYDK